MDNNLKREIILDNYQDPMNRGLIEDDSYIKVNTNSESCIDNLDFMMKIENDKVAASKKAREKAKKSKEDKMKGKKK